jgi:hypothetical protein
MALLMGLSEDDSHFTPRDKVIVARHDLYSSQNEILNDKQHDGGPTSPPSLSASGVWAHLSFPVARCFSFEFLLSAFLMMMFSFFVYQLEISLHQ